MEAILEIYGETGNVQASGDGGIGFGLSATGNVTLVNDGATHPQPMVIAQVSVQGQNPIFSFKANGAVCIERISQSGSTFTFHLRAQSNVPIGLQYWVFDTSAGSIKDPTMADIEASLYDQFGVKTIDFTNSFMRIAGSYAVPQHNGAVPSGRDVNLSNTQTFTVPAGRVYAIVQATPAYIFTTFDQGGYSNSETAPDTVLDPNPGDIEPGSGLYNWRQQELQSYQATAGYVGGNVIEAGLTRFEQFDLGWQPQNSTPFCQVYGTPRHIILDVTNFVAAGTIDPTTVVGNVNATTRSVTTGGAESIPSSTTPAVTVSASGGTAPYSYSWQFVSGTNTVVPNGASSQTTFATVTTNQPASTIRSAIYRCRITDANGYVGFTPDVTFTHVADAYAEDYIPNALALSPLTLTSNLNQEAIGDVADLVGFNRDITLRVERYNFSGNIDAAAVYVYRGPTAGQWGPWELVGQFDPRGAGQAFVDFVVTPNSRLHYVIESVSYSGRKDYSMDMVVWNLSNPGGAAQISTGKRITVTVDADNNHNVPDYTLDPIDWADFTVTTTGNYTGSNHNGQNATGINQAVTLRSYIVNYSGSMTDGYLRAYHWNGGTPQLRGEARYAGGNTSFAWTVNPGEHIYFTCDALTDSGRKTAGFDVHTYNESAGNQFVDAFHVHCDVDTDNNHNVADWTPDAISVPNLTGYVSNEPDFTTDGRFFQITGINRQIWLRFIRTYYELSQTGAINTRRLMIYHSTTGSGGPWTPYFLGAGTPENSVPYSDVACNNGDWFYVQGWVTTTAGRGTASWRNYIDFHDGVTVLGRLATFDIGVTVDADDNFYQADYTATPQAFPNLSFSTADYYGAASHNWQVTGVNRDILVRVHVTNLTRNMQDGYLYLARQSDGHQFGKQHYSLVGTGAGYFDCWIPPDTQFYWYFDGNTNSGARSATFDVTVENLSAGQIIGTFSCSGVVDNDNNYNIAPVDYDPDPIAFAPINASTFDSTNTTVVGSNGPYTMTGFGAAVTMRAYIGVWSHNFNQHMNSGGPVEVGDGPTSGTLSLHVYVNGGIVAAVDHNLYGQFSGAEFYQFVDFNVNPGDTVQFYTILSAHLSDQDAFLIGETQGGIYFDRIDGQRLGSFTHTMSVNKQGTGF